MSMHGDSAAVISDEQLWRRSQTGDREAFGCLVERHQSLVCALAYSACGDVARSEDLAQETFVTAWQHLGELREPAKVRAWLCGIVRNLAANTRRRDRRRGGEPDSLETVAEHPSPGPDPAAEAVSRDEAALLWRTLAGMPEVYREALVLFYREQRSVAEVAAGLELSEDAVKQRLSRGRAMLRDEMLARVESALIRTGPTAAFTTAVLAAISIGSVPAAGAAVAAAALSGKGAAGVGKGVLLGLNPWVVLGPMLGMVSTWFSTQAAALTARSAEERQVVSRTGRRMGVFSLLMSIGLAVTMRWAAVTQGISPIWLLLGSFVWVAVLLAVLFRANQRMQREVSRIRTETGTDDPAYAMRLARHRLTLDRGVNYESRWRFLGLPLAAFASGGLDAGSHRSRTARAWIAGGDLAISPLLAFGGVAIAPIALGGVSIGLISVGGCAFGGLALGGIAAGGCAFGPGALGWTAAAGGLAVARDYAVGGIVRAAEANTEVAKAWFGSQWFIEPVGFFFQHAFWVILLSAVIPLGLVVWRAWKRRRLGWEMSKN
jgi:RNA polymerase sigma factor (sigma-70 family)